MFGGRIWGFAFEIMGFLTELALIFYPHYLVLVAYWALILPDRLVETYEKWQELEIEMPQLSSFMFLLFGHTSAPNGRGSEQGHQNRRRMKSGRFDQVIKESAGKSFEL